MQPLGLGLSYVNFDRDVSNCAVALASGYIALEPRVDNDTIFVTPRDFSGNTVDVPVEVTVTC